MIYGNSTDKLKCEEILYSECYRRFEQFDKSLAKITKLTFIDYQLVKLNRILYKLRPKIFNSYLEEYPSCVIL